MIYIDTSAFVKYYGKKEIEKGVDKIIELIEKAKKGEEILVSSIFLIGETISVFDKWSRMRIITEEESSELISDFLNDIIELFGMGGLIVETINPLVIIFSLELITKHHIPINDAIHLYTASTYKPKIEEFVCSDEILLKAAKEEGLKIYNPEE